METDKIITFGDLLKEKGQHLTNNKKDKFYVDEKNNQKKYQLFGEPKKPKNMQTLQSKI